MAQQPPRRVLIYRAGALGDAIVAIPAINLIRRHFPDARLTLMTVGATATSEVVWSGDVLDACVGFDEYIRYEASTLTNLPRLWRLLQEVRRQEPDLVVHLGTDKNSMIRVFRDRMFFWVAGARRFIPCYSSKAMVFGALRRTRRVYESEVIRLVKCLSQIGITNGQIAFDLPRRAEHIQTVSDRLSASRLLEGHPLVGLCPGSKQEIKRWPVERFAEIGKMLIQDGGVNIAVVGGPDELEAGRHISAAWPNGRWVNLADQLSVLESAELLRRCLFYVGNDTGAMHLAASVGTRCVGIFSARDAEGSWYPFGSNHITLRKNVSCQNCYLHVCEKEALRCLSGISVDEVWVACLRMLVYS